jgi:hypothetical protein
MPADFRAEGLWPVQSRSTGQLLLLPRAQEAREVLPQEMINQELPSMWCRAINRAAARYPGDRIGSKRQY